MAKKEKEKKVKGEKAAKTEKKARGTANRLTRADKILKRLRGVEASTSFKSKSAVFNVRVIGREATPINGFIVEETASGVLFRHKRTNASKRMMVSRFANTDIVELYGAIGEASQLTVYRETVIREVTGKIVDDKNGVVTVQTVSGETVKFYPNAHTTIEISVEDGSGEGASEGKKSKKDKGEKASKKSKKKASRDEDEDDEDDDDDLDD